MIEYHNGIALIANDTHICRWVKESNRLDHDQNVLPLILPLIPVDGMVVDAGAFCGDHTIAYAKKVGKSGIVMAFEPFNDSFDCLAYNMYDYPQVHCFKMALGNEYGKISASCTNNNFGMATISKSEDGNPILPLDDFMINKLDFFKIDTEGTEIDVLLGAIKTIEKFKPIMFIEVNEHTLRVKGHTKNDLLKTISDLGYRYRNVYEGQGLGDEQFDVICFPVL